MKEYMDAVTSPQVAVPVVTTSTLISTFMDNLPVLLNICSFIYILLLIIHKVWGMYKEYKNKPKE